MRRRIVFGFMVPLGLALLTALVVYRIIRTHNEDFNRVTTTSRTS